MQQNNILTVLQERAKEQQIVSNVPFRNLFLFLSQLLGEKPWKIIIPFSFLLTLGLHIFFGKAFDEAILVLFGNI